MQTHQGILENALSSIFPGLNAIKNARKEVAVKNPVTGDYLEVDVWYPTIQLCFEYQDDHHYQPTWYSQIPLALVQNKDYTKKDLLLRRHETLVVIPCWWDGRVSSLQATIKYHRPDLQLSVPVDYVDHLIPFNPPLHLFSVPENLQLMLASFPSSHEALVLTCKNVWWLGEKYDGIRCYWNPGENQMFSRHGSVLELPTTIKNLFGYVVLDGEVWCGRGLYLEAQTGVQSSLSSLHWCLLRVVCFDEASQRLVDQPFEKRYTRILAHFPAEHPCVVIASRLLCTSTRSLFVNLQQVVEAGGEGVILRKPNSLYHFGRSPDLLKLKASRSDRDALVMQVEEDGSLLLQLPEGATFLVSKKDCVLPRRPVRGDVVTFAQDFASRNAFARANTQETLVTCVPAQGAAHDAQDHAETPPEFARGVPSNPTVYRIRTDVVWEDIVRNMSPSVRQFINEPHQKLSQQKPQRSWTSESGKKMRNCLESILRYKGLDPRSAQNWYSVSRDEFMQHREVRTLVKHFDGSLMKAIVELFPELELDISKFSTTPVNFWGHAANRRKLYELYAYEKGGDSLDPNFWYSQDSKEMLTFRGVRTVVKYYTSYVESIVHLFPELRLDVNKFKRTPVLSWVQEQDRRDFFDNFAAAQGFDPLVPDNWYNVSYSLLREYQGYDSIVRQYYNGRLSECLMHLYPDIGLVPSKFQFHKLSFWQSFANRKRACIEFANVRGFDPLAAENWYIISSSDFESVPELGAMLRFYSGKYIDALVDLFPEIHFDPTRFTTVPLGFWEDVKNRKNLFIEIARQRGFDPLIASNWYPVSYGSLEKIKGLSSVVKNYYGGMAKALVHLFPEIGLEESKFRDFWGKKETRRKQK